MPIIKMVYSCCSHCQKEGRVSSKERIGPQEHVHQLNELVVQGKSSKDTVARCLLWREAEGNNFNVEVYLALQ